MANLCTRYASGCWIGKSSFWGRRYDAHVAIPVRKLTVNGVNFRLLFDGCQSRLCLVPVSSYCVGVLNAVKTFRVANRYFVVFPGMVPCS